MDVSAGARQRLTLAVATALAVALSSQAHAQATSEARGHALVLRNCAMCHAVETVGDSPNPQAPPFRRLHERYAVEDLGDAIAEGIRVGHPQMPEFRFGAHEIIDIIAYVKSIQTDTHAQGAGGALAEFAAAPSPLSGQAAAGR